MIRIKKNKKITPFHFPKPTLEDISLIIKSLNLKKATGPDCILLKVIKFASNFNSHLSNITIKDLEKSKYS